MNADLHPLQWKLFSGFRASSKRGPARLFGASGSLPLKWTPKQRDTADVII